MLVGAIADGETRVEGFGRSADTESTIAAVRALGVSVHEDDGRCRCGSRAPACAACASRRTDRLRQLRHDAAAARRDPRRPGGPLRADRRRVAVAGGPVERIAEPLAPDGRAASRPTTGTPPLDVEGGALQRRSATSSRRERPGEVVRAARGAATPTGRTTVVEPAADARPHRADARGRRRARDRRQRRRLGRAGRAPGAARTIEVPGDFSVRGAVPRRRDAAPGLGADDPRRRRQPDAHGPPRRARAHGRPDHASSTGAAAAASRSATSRCSPRSSTATKVTAEEVPRLVDELPLFALAAACARGESRRLRRARSCA